jgi:ubiquinone/menaquinone biosynthesis C-methylase UbiE
LPGYGFEEKSRRRRTVSEEKYFQYYPPDESFIMRIGFRQRRRMFADFLRYIQPQPQETILDIGATGNQQYASQQNYLEQWYPHKSAVTAAGLEDASFLEKQFPGMRFVQITAGRMPFKDCQFDHVHGSAVLEHVGSRQAQTEFLRELWRVGNRTVFLTTPNRWFPVEVHTVLPLVHWLPKRIFRRILKAIGKGFFASENNLNLLTRRDLKKICREAGWQNIRICPVRLWGWTSNWMIMGRKSENRE